MIPVYSLARSINDDVRNRELFIASCQVKETIEIWKKRANYDLLCDEAQSMAELYILKQYI
ncbi:MAG: hypothetical protein D8M57_18655 [Candidatus Scalindua sp. AMX11]|nr:MAG: hypothetical protein DWQ00_17490 [Candidatus Scalindua sp.]NOG83252.1 hypothetical protein [Planctomycetota bacterium]RZV71986.1 MAG: hypothetical protein EX341_14760 [Candidatus Scalindua sp. SCAELEC01]TDE63380.1 MAG: hypothetical protein D8M57_18655 [Candidatus Scalindua sp. AMX11]GJQ57574.1 MAG: hypothetical protein SCALA701_03750 [Candidatus Scalindua sp.]